MYIKIFNQREKLDNILVFTAFFLITIAQCTSFSNISSLLTYTGLMLMCIVICNATVKKVNIGTVIKRLVVTVLLAFVLSLGILKGNHILNSKKIELFISFFLPCFYFEFGGYLFDSKEKLGKIVKAVLYAYIFSFILSIGLSHAVYQAVGEGLSIGITAGLGHKNAVGNTLLVPLFCLLWNTKIKGEGNKSDRIWLIIIIILIILTSSRTACLMMLLSLIIIYMKSMKRFAKKYRFLLIMLGGIIGGFLFIWLLNNYILASANYNIRLLGINSYLKAYGNDLDSLIWGIGDVLYDSSVNYHSAFWTVLGGQGSTEIALLNIIAKNGLLGLGVYVYFIFSTLLYALKSKVYNYKLMVFSLLVPLVSSLFVEVYVTQIIYPYTVFVFCSMSSFKINKERLVN